MGLAPAHPPGDIRYLPHLLGPIGLFRRPLGSLSGTIYVPLMLKFALRIEFSYRPKEIALKNLCPLNAHSHLPRLRAVKNGS